MFDPMPISREAEGTPVEVKLYVDGSRLASKHSFDIVYKNTVGDLRNDLFDQTPATRGVILGLLDDNADGTVDRSEDVLVRDSQYRANTVRINLGRRKREVSETITFDPFNFPGHAAIEAALRAPDSRARFFPMSDPTGTDEGYPVTDPPTDDHSWVTRTDANPPRSHILAAEAGNFHTPTAATAQDAPNDERRYQLVRANRPARKDDKTLSTLKLLAVYR